MDEYFERIQIEAIFKTAKDYINLLPLSKWTLTRIRGKLLLDIISTIIVKNIIKNIPDKFISVSEIFSKTRSLMCTANNEGKVVIEIPNKKTKNYFSMINTVVRASLSLDDLRRDLRL